MLSIGAFSKTSNVTTKTLRYYDEIGLIKPVHVNKENGYRYYDVSQLKTILLINKLKMYCFSLEEIAEVLTNPYDDRLLSTLIKQKQRSIQEKQEHYQYILKRLDEDISKLERGINIMSYMDEILVKLVETQPKTILFSRAVMSTGDTGRYLGKLYERIAKERLTIAGPPLTIFHVEDEFNPDSYDNEVAVPICETAEGTREHTGGLCAMAVLKGPYSELSSVYAKLSQWVEEQGYTNAGEPYEVYLTDPANVAPEENITEVYIPVKK